MGKYAPTILLEQIRQQEEVNHVSANVNKVWSTGHGFSGFRDGRTGFGAAIVDYAFAYERAHDLAPMAIAALDAHGRIVALKMEDGSGLMRPEIAAGKAWGLSAWGSALAISLIAPNC